MLPSVLCFLLIDKSDDLAPPGLMQFGNIDMFSPMLKKQWRVKGLIVVTYRVFVAHLNFRLQATILSKVVHAVCPTCLQQHHVHTCWLEDSTVLKCKAQSSSAKPSPQVQSPVVECKAQ